MFGWGFRDRVDVFSLKQKLCQKMLVLGEIDKFTLVWAPSVRSPVAAGGGGGGGGGGRSMQWIEGRRKALGSIPGIAPLPWFCLLQCYIHEMSRGDPR